MGQSTEFRGEDGELVVREVQGLERVEGRDGGRQTVQGIMLHLETLQLLQLSNVFWQHRWITTETDTQTHEAVSSIRRKAQEVRTSMQGKNATTSHHIITRADIVHYLTRYSI